MNRTFTSTLKSLALALLMIAGVSYAQTSGWTAPTATPPAGNTPAPVNVGARLQSKGGPLDVAGVFTGTRAIFSDRVGIRDASPAANLLLDVEGRVGATQYCDQDGHNCVSPNALVDAGVPSGTFCGSVSADHRAGVINRIPCGGRQLNQNATNGNCPTGYTFRTYFQADSNFGYTCTKN